MKVDLAIGRPGEGRGKDRPTGADFGHATGASGIQVIHWTSGRFDLSVQFSRKPLPIPGGREREICPAQCPGPVAAESSI